MRSPARGMYQPPAFQAAFLTHACFFQLPLTSAMCRANFRLARRRQRLASLGLIVPLTTPMSALTVWRGRPSASTSSPTRKSAFSSALRGRQGGLDAQQSQVVAGIAPDQLGREARAIVGADADFVIAFDDMMRGDDEILRPGDAGRGQAPPRINPQDGFRGARHQIRQFV